MSEVLRAHFAIPVVDVSAAPPARSPRHRACCPHPCGPSASPLISTNWVRRRRCHGAMPIPFNIAVCGLLAASSLLEGSGLIQAALFDFSDLSLIPNGHLPTVRERCQ